MKPLTVLEAAEILEISRQRVMVLIELGRIRVLSERQGPGAGRPALLVSAWDVRREQIRRQREGLQT